MAVRRPSDSWIDVGLHDARAGVLVATEVQSDLRRLEQLIRWAEEKVASLPSWEGWTHLGPVTEVSRLLVVRDTRTNRAIAREFRRTLAAAYPAHQDDGLAALTGGAPWPGPALLWTSEDSAPGSSLRIVARR